MKEQMTLYFLSFGMMLLTIAFAHVEGGFTPNTRVSLWGAVFYLGLVRLLSVLPVNEE